jgi:hypothetical protein
VSALIPMIGRPLGLYKDLWARKCIKSSGGKSTRLHKDLWAHECVESIEEEIGGVTGYITTCVSVNVLNMMVGK